MAIQASILNALVAVATVLALTGCAQLGQPIGGALKEQDRSEHLALVQASADAWNRGDLKGHLAIYDSSVTVMTKTGPRPTIEAIERSFGQTYFVNGKAKQDLRMESLAIRPLSEGSALMTGRFILSGGSAPEQFGWFTLVWVRTPLGWRAVHDHTS